MASGYKSAAAQICTLVTDNIRQKNPLTSNEIMNTST